MEALKFETEFAKFADKYIKGLEKGKPIMTPEEFNKRIIRMEETLRTIYNINYLYKTQGVIDMPKADAIKAWAKKEDTPQDYRNLYRTEK